MQKINAIEVSELVKRYGDITAINRLSFFVRKGEIFGLLGPNGAGKSTTINILCGLLEPTSGTALVLENNIEKEPMKIKQKIGVCPQEPSVFSYLTARENIELMGTLQGLEKSKLKDNIEILLHKMGLSEIANRRVSKYSGGMIRRTSLAMALIHDPPLAFLDEPTVGMDPQSRRATWDMIHELKEKGRTIILTTHYIEEAEALADRVGIIDYGRLIALDKPKTLMKEHKAENLEEVFIELTGRRIRESI